MDSTEITADFEIRSKRQLFALLLASPFLIAPIICIVIMFFMGKVSFSNFTSK